MKTAPPLYNVSRQRLVALVIKDPDLKVNNLRCILLYIDYLYDIYYAKKSISTLTYAQNYAP